MRSGWLSPSPVIEQFESAAARAVGQSGGVAVSSGTAALYLTLRALGIGRGDEVVLPSYVCSALWHAVTAAGATPRLAEIDPASFNLSPSAARKRLTRRTKAIIVPHLFGLPADLSALRALGPALIEDCAQTLGVRYRGRPVGSFGVATICSFYATKLITAGEGGLIASSSPRVLARLRAARAYDEQPRLAPSFNFKLSALHAALGLSQLRRLRRILALRRGIARRYDRAFADLPVIVPPRFYDRGHAYYRYVVRVPLPAGQAGGGAGPVMARLHRLGVTARRPVFEPIHDALGLRGYPVTDRAWQEALSLPIYPGLNASEMARVIAAVRTLLGGRTNARRKKTR